MRPVKIVVVGDGAVGKTCLCITYANGVFPEDYVPTIFDNYAATSTIDELTYNLALWDTAGQEEYDSVSSKWAPETHHHCPSAPCILVGTKADLRESPEVLQTLKEAGNAPIRQEQCMSLAKEIGALKYVECSALHKDGIQAVFQDSIRAVLAPAKSEKKGKNCVTL